jgi:hypothetical protein
MKLPVIQYVWEVEYVGYIVGRGGKLSALQFEQ